MWSLLTSTSAPSPTGAADSGAQATRADERAVRCKACGAPLSEERLATERFGAHEHERVNPAGHAFRLQLFEKAAGAVMVGAESAEFAWFPHHLWNVALCAGCGHHVGWRFRQKDAGFFGLIAHAIARSAS